MGSRVDTSGDNQNAMLSPFNDVKTVETIE